MCTCEPTPQAEPAFKPWLKPTPNERKAREAAAGRRGLIAAAHWPQTAAHGTFHAILKELLWEGS